MADQYEPVTFLNSAGEVISNDPIYLAQQQLAAAGLINPQVTPVVPVAHDDDELGEDSDEDKVDYATLNGPQLKALAKERGVDIKGLRTVGEVRKALADAEAEADEE